MYSAFDTLNKARDHHAPIKSIKLWAIPRCFHILLKMRKYSLMNLTAMLSPTTTQCVSHSHFKRVTLNPAITISNENVPLHHPPRYTSVFRSTGFRNLKIVPRGFRLWMMECDPGCCNK